MTSCATWPTSTVSPPRHRDCAPTSSWSGPPEHFDDEDATVLALAGDLDSPQMQVLGRYDNEYVAGQASPPAVPPGVLRPDAAHYRLRVPAAEVSVQELVRDVVGARHSGDVSEAPWTAADDTGHAPSHLTRMTELVDTAAEFADALETRAGQHAAVRLGVIAQQLRVLSRELHAAAEELSADAGVLPPHRTRRPRFLPAPSQPALTTTPPATAPPAAAPAHRR
ncbi:hypothetical protein [Streptomyces sp. NPDC019890]|uniref:hypothetical protein n=1 Tax=Streptomyces sp. NPDC019890 TaxID=3365064 RepID=UPI003850F020